MDQILGTAAVDMVGQSFIVVSTGVSGLSDKQCSGSMVIGLIIRERELETWLQ